MKLQLDHIKSLWEGIVGDTNELAPPELQEYNANLNHEPSVPGAHAVGGRPTFAPTTNHSTTASTSNETAGSVLCGFVVEDDEEIPATVVQTTPTVELVEAELMTEKRQTNKRVSNPCFLTIITPVLASVAGLVAAWVLLKGSSPNPNSALDPKPSGTCSPFQKGLPPEIANGIQDVTSSYYKANVWMQQDPYLDTYNPTRQLQRYLMVYLYYQSNGIGWIRSKDWLSYTVPECLWFNQNSSLDADGWHPGVEPLPVCDDYGNIQVLNLSSNNLEGEAVFTKHPISPRMHIVDLSHNQLYGLPPVVGFHATGFEVVILSNNSFSGQLVGGGNFPPFSLRIVKLDANQFIGGGNGIICSVLPHLEVLNLTDNLYYGDINDELRYCKNLTYLGLGSSLRTGGLPSELGLLSKKLKVLDVSNNPSMTGTIPEEYDQLTNLDLLDISGTPIGGRIPSGVCDLVDNKALELVANCNQVQCCE